MNNKEETNSAQMAHRTHKGILSASLGLITLGAAAMVGVISFTAFNPPDWFRFGTFALLGVGFFGSVILGLQGLRDPRRA